MKVFVLSASTITHKLRGITPIFDCPALLPVHMKALGTFILDFYKKYNYEVNFVVFKSQVDTLVKEFRSYNNINVIGIDPTENVNQTLNTAIANVKDDEVIINLVTTVPTQLPELDNVCVSEEIHETKNYSLICNLDSNIEFISKNSENASKGHAFTGVFRLKTSELKKSVSENLNSSDLLTTIETYNNSRPINITKAQWLDFGHASNFIKSKLRLFVSRAFNTFSVDFTRGLLVKRSLEKEKLQKEKKYYLNTPVQLKSFFPRVLEDGDTETIKMELYGYPTLSEYFLYWNLDENIWNDIFSKVYDVVNLFKKEKASIDNNTLLDFYVKKLDQRVQSFRKQFPDDAIFRENTLIVNGRELDNLAILNEKINLKVESLYNEDDCCFVHGDLCFNNILYDTNASIMRFIDPRGSISEEASIFGDIKYDISKFLHSAVYKYDFLANDLFEFSEQNGAYTYSINSRDSQKMLEKKSYELVSKLGYEIKDIKFIISVLFLSMAPLHSENVNRQKVMYLHGLTILNEVLGE